MSSGEFYLLANDICEVVVVPDRPAVVAEARLSLKEHGISELVATHVGNFAVQLSEEVGLSDLQHVIPGRVVYPPEAV